MLLTTKEVLEMTERDVVREAMKLRGWSQQTLADEAGFKRQSNVSNLLNSRENGMRVDNLLKLLNAMGCELVVRDKMGSKKEWTITSEPDAEPEHVPTVEELLVAKKISFEEAVARGWRPSAAMLDKLLGEK